ncbi:hypothetical protein PIB30_041575 [Stylosanthes scabra]|uniref:Uncharacterized protein n=1 Tax=Stylosanthes scabra TaxID=79078 RepID=A0ABU6RF27_9FABA|nr:hypothetical protein [Stylosanthes scabra]
MMNSNRGTVHTSPLGPRLEAQPITGSSLGPTCVCRIPTCVELSQQRMHRPVRTMEELCRVLTYLDLEPHQENDPDLGQRKGRYTPQPVPAEAYGGCALGSSRSRLLGSSQWLLGDAPEEPHEQSLLPNRPRKQAKAHRLGKPHRLYRVRRGSTASITSQAP